MYEQVLIEAAARDYSRLHQDNPSIEDAFAEGARWMAAFKRSSFEPAYLCSGSASLYSGWWPVHRSLQMAAITLSEVTSVIWHKASCVPAEEQAIVYVTKNNKIGMLVHANVESWDWYVEKYSIVSWCYSAHLLPKGDKK